MKIEAKSFVIGLSAGYTSILLSLFIFDYVEIDFNDSIKSMNQDQTIEVSIKHTIEDGVN